MGMTMKNGKTVKNGTRISRKQHKHSKQHKQGKQRKQGNQRKQGKQRKQRKQSKKIFEKAKCSAGKSINDFTCYDGEALIKLKMLWNARHPDAEIEETGNKEIWSALKNNMSNVCNTEKCWLRQNFAKNNLSSDLKTYTFAPDSPKTWLQNPNEWLSSVDIQKVMTQYEAKHKNFIFLGPSPIDFDNHVRDGECVWKELCEFDLKKQMTDKKTKMGIIFNTDPHYSSGSHWISLFVDAINNQIFFFDSTGEPAPKEVTALMNRIMSQGKNMGMDFKKIVNDKTHQKSDTECGMYCLHMIISILESKHDPSYFLTHRISDAEMEHLRGEYFNKPVIQ
jgi:hypothetical protein